MNMTRGLCRLQSLTRLGSANYSSKAVDRNTLNVDCYFDTISPYSWPAFEVLCRYKDKWNLAVNWKPVFMGGITHGSGNPYLQGLGSCPNKAKYTFEDLPRTAKFFRLNMSVKEDPFTHIGVIGSLQQQRFVTAVQQNAPDKFERVCREIWKRSWGKEDATVHTEEDLTIIGKRAGLSEVELSSCFAASQSQTVKEELKRTTEEAVGRGAFGVPTTVWCLECHKDQQELVFGSDRFELVAALFQRKWEGPIPGENKQG